MAQTVIIKSMPYEEENDLNQYVLAVAFNEIEKLVKVILSFILNVFYTE